MKRSILVMVIILSVANIASAEIIRDGIDIDFVTIGNPGNPGDTRTVYPDSADPYGAGAVAYQYQIGKYEISNAQWNAFTSAVGTPTGNPSDAYDGIAFFHGTNVPVDGVHWLEAAQFCNYLTSGDKSQGAYLFSGNNTNPGDFLGIDRDSAVADYGIAYVTPTEDEWYKAAYYTGSGYSTYANGTDVAPTAGVATNYDNVIGQPWDVGTGTMEQNGTFNMMGNAWEVNETLTGSRHVMRGGSYFWPGHNLTSSRRSFYTPPEFLGLTIGFRVASVPEPTTLLLLGLGGLMLRRKR